MAMRDPELIAFGAQSGENSASITTNPIRYGYITHKQPRKHDEADIPSCTALDLQCLCSIATNYPWVPLPASALASEKCPQALGETKTATATPPGARPPDVPPGAPSTPTPTTSISSLNAQGTSTSSRPSTSFPSQTATGTPSTSVVAPSRSPTPSTSSAPSGGNANTSDHPPSSSSTTARAATPSFPPSPTPLPIGPSPATAPPNPPGLAPGTIVGVVLGAIALFLVIALTLVVLFRRRARRRELRRVSLESARRRLKPYIYDDDSVSGPLTSVWTGFGSASIDPHFSPKRESMRTIHTLDFRLVDNAKDGLGLVPVRLSRTYTHIPGLPPPPRPPPSETQPPARDRDAERDRALLPLPDSLGLAYLGSPEATPAPGLASSSELLLLAGTDYHAINPFGDHDGALERKASGASRTTATSGDVQSVEAL